jgi:hypothetical protein
METFSHPFLLMNSSSAELLMEPNRTAPMETFSHPFLLMNSSSAELLMEPNPGTADAQR